MPHSHSRHNPAANLSPTSPSPALMAGRRDPALSVRPVDYTQATRDHARRRAQNQRATDDFVTDSAVDRPTTSSAIDRGVSAQDRAALAGHIMEALRTNTNQALTAPGSLYSVVSGQPVPTGDALELSPPRGPVEVVGAWGATLHDLQRCIEDPDDTWSTDLGASDYFLRGDLCVRIRRSDAQIMGIYHAGWALARRPDRPLPEEPGSGRSASRGQGTRYPTSQPELVKRLRAAGFIVTTSGPTHGKITHPDHPGRFLPYSSTPSGQRYGRHVVTAVKRVFGIDLRKPPQAAEG